MQHIRLTLRAICRCGVAISDLQHKPAPTTPRKVAFATNFDGYRRSQLQISSQKELGVNLVLKRDISFHMYDNVSKRV